MCTNSFDRKEVRAKIYFVTFSNSFAAIMKLQAILWGKNKATRVSQYDGKAKTSQAHLYIQERYGAISVS